MALRLSTLSDFILTHSWKSSKSNCDQFDSFDNFYEEFVWFEFIFLDYSNYLWSF